MKRTDLHKLFPALFLWIGLLLGFLPLYMHESDGGSLLWEVYPIIQIFIWLGLGYFFRRIYISVYKDELTNLWNRKYLYVRLEDELRKLRGNKDLSLAIVDIDNFKNVNDTHGHLFGDKVLTEVANILQDNVRKSDTVSRWGGEEFMILLPKTDGKGAKVVFERIRQIVEKNDFGCHITISGGIAFIREYIEMNQFIEMADKALYEAKRSKNLITIYKK